jgi:hypothetical protein
LQASVRTGANVRIGAEHTLSAKWRVGAGAFTDLNSSEGQNLDYYGFSAGTSYTHVYELRDGRRLRFISALSARAAIGSGELLVPALPSIVSGSSFANRQYSSDARSTLLTISIGSGVTY